MLLTKEVSDCVAFVTVICFDKFAIVALTTLIFTNLDNLIKHYFNGSSWTYNMLICSKEHKEGSKKYRKIEIVYLIFCLLKSLKMHQYDVCHDIVF